MAVFFGVPELDKLLDEAKATLKTANAQTCEQLSINGYVSAGTAGGDIQGLMPNMRTQVPRDFASGKLKKYDGGNLNSEFCDAFGKNEQEWLDAILIYMDSKPALKPIATKLKHDFGKFDATAALAKTLGTLNREKKSSVKGFYKSPQFKQLLVANDIYESKEFKLVSEEGWNGDMKVDDKVLGTDMSVDQFNAILYANFESMKETFHHKKTGIVYSDADITFIMASVAMTLAYGIVDPTHDVRESVYDTATMVENFREAAKDEPDEIKRFVMLIKNCFEKFPAVTMLYGGTFNVRHNSNHTIGQERFPKVLESQLKVNDMAIEYPGRSTSTVNQKVKQPGGVEAMAAVTVKQIYDAKRSAIYDGVHRFPHSFQCAQFHPDMRPLPILTLNSLGVPLKISGDVTVQVRATGPPAGTRQLFHAHKAVTDLAGMSLLHPVLMITNMVSEYQNLMNAVGIIKSNPMAFHPAHRYLTRFMPFTSDFSDDLKFALSTGLSGTMLHRDTILANNQGTVNCQTLIAMAHAFLYRVSPSFKSQPWIKVKGDQFDNAHVLGIFDQVADGSAGDPTLILKIASANISGTGLSTDELTEFAKDTNNVVLRNKLSLKISAAQNEMLSKVRVTSAKAIRDTVANLSDAMIDDDPEPDPFASSSGPSSPSKRRMVTRSSSLIPDA